MSSHLRPHDLLRLAADGRRTRRDLLKRGAALGLSAPAIAALLAACGGSASSSTSAASSSPSSSSGGTSATATATPSAATPASPVFNPSAATPQASSSGGSRGGKGTLNLLWWEAPTILNPHLAQGTKDFDASRVVYEPLADFDKNTNMVPYLAAEVPSLANGDVASDGKSVTWKLRQGVKWHDGQPFTANDVKFTFEFVSNPGTAATTSGTYLNVASVDVVDDYTVRINFKNPEPGWYQPFTGPNGMILPQHIFQSYVGTSAHNAPANLNPVGTGSYKLTSFKPGDTVAYAINDDYWMPGAPHFDSVVMKGGGSADTAAQAVLQSGESDYAWNIQVEPNVLNSMLAGGKGKVLTWAGGGTEKILINHSDPNTESNGQKSYYQVPHPHFKVLEVRQALASAIDRKTAATQLYGAGGDATGQTQNENTPYMLPASDPAAQWKFDLKAASDLLDKAGAQKGSDGIRTLNGRKMSWLYQTSVNTVRQNNQQIVKQALGQIGIDVQLKSIDASVYFSGDAGNTDTSSHFYADLEMYTNGAGVFPLQWYQRYLSADPATDIDQASNQWDGYNDLRYQNTQFNQLYAQAATELDPQKSIQLFQQMQRVVLNDVAEIGEIARNNVACVANRITGNNPTQWASDLWDLHDWTTTT